MKKILTLLGVILGIFLICVFYENYIPHKRTEKEYIINDTCIKDTTIIDSLKLDSI